MILKSTSHHKTSNKKRECRIYNEESITHFKALILHEDWNDVITDNEHDSKWDKFFQKTDKLFEEAFPVKPSK